MQTKQKALRRSLWASALAILLCIAMLLGTTFAWFTDTVSSANNTIKSGTLDIVAQVADVDVNGTTYTITGVNSDQPFGFGTLTDIEKADPIISETLWEPGKTGAKLVSVTNKGSLAAKVKLQFDVQKGDLQDALWFDFVQVDGDKTTGTFTKRPMSSINTLASSTEFPLGPKDGDNPKDTVQFILVYGMYEDAGNEYQDKEFKATVNIVATQYTYETDGFGSNQYDKDAPLDFVAVSTADDLKSAVEAGGEVKLTENVTKNFDTNNSTSVLTFTQDGTSVDFGGKSLTVTSENGKNGITVDEKNITVTMSSGTITQDKTYGSTYTVVNVNEASTLVLNNMVITGPTGKYTYVMKAAGKEGAKIVLNNCTITGNIMVGSGAQLEAHNSTINGELAVQASAMAILDNETTYQSMSGSGTISGGKQQ